MTLDSMPFREDGVSGNDTSSEGYERLAKQNPSPARRWVTKEEDPVEDKVGEIGKINLRKWVQHNAASPRGEARYKKKVLPREESFRGADSGSMEVGAALCCLDPSTYREGEVT